MYLLYIYDKLLMFYNCLLIFRDCLLLLHSTRNFLVILGRLTLVTSFENQSNKIAFEKFKISLEKFIRNSIRLQSKFH